MKVKQKRQEQDRKLQLITILKTIKVLNFTLNIFLMGIISTTNQYDIVLGLLHSTKYVHVPKRLRTGLIPHLSIRKIIKTTLSRHIVIAHML